MKKENVSIKKLSSVQDVSASNANSKLFTFLKTALLVISLFIFSQIASASTTVSIVGVNAPSEIIEGSSYRVDIFLKSSGSTSAVYVINWGNGDKEMIGITDDLLISDWGIYEASLDFDSPVYDIPGQYTGTFMIAWRSCVPGPDPDSEPSCSTLTQTASWNITVIPDNCPDDPNKIEPGVCGCGVPDKDSDEDGIKDCNEIPARLEIVKAPSEVKPGELYKIELRCISDFGCAIKVKWGDGTVFDLSFFGLLSTPCYEDSDIYCFEHQYKEKGQYTWSAVASDLYGTGNTVSHGVSVVDDQCPDNPDKLEPGECGCDVPDTDSDKDGTPDCNDKCPSDSNKIEPGECGCGIKDIVEGDNIICKGSAPIESIGGDPSAPPSCMEGEKRTGDPLTPPPARRPLSAIC